ncbi:hypothetical protein [Streptomyces sp. gb1(2016)]|uniref:hypothetical protein n=1 Tax=Streptomyces sp. gb1(2016) TaxID=1828321 RepID=UPI0021C7A651|nr:hypothetical protein [Streptomyces sp. gb1(2016)]
MSASRPTKLVSLARRLPGGAVRGAGAVLLPDGHVTTSLERSNVAAAEGLARGVLGGAAYEAAHTEGGGLSQKEATALAETYTD